MEKKINKRRFISQIDTISGVTLAICAVLTFIFLLIKDSNNERIQLVIYYTGKFFQEFVILLLIIIFRKGIWKFILSVKNRVKFKFYTFKKKKLIFQVLYYFVIILLILSTIFFVRNYVNRKISSPTLFNKAIKAEQKGLYRKSLTYYNKQIKLFPYQAITDKAILRAKTIRKRMYESKALLDEYLIRQKVGPLDEEKVYLLLRAINLDQENISALEQAEKIVLKEKERRALLSEGIQEIKERNWQNAKKIFEKINSKYKNYGHSKEMVKELNEFLRLTNKKYYLKDIMDKDTIKSLHNRNIILVPYCFYTKQIEECINELTKYHQINHLETLVRKK